MATVHVEGISTKTSEDEIKSFFSFCGKISSLSVTPTDADSQSATVTFEKPAAAKTALLLDNTQLGPNSVHVSAAKSIDELGGDKTTTEDALEHENIAQEEKPRSRIFAEYLAHGYTISDKAIERAIALDSQHGISNKFTSSLKSFDDRFKATEKAQTVDTKFGISSKATTGWNTLSSYFNRAAETPTGQKLRQFYEVGNKTVMDVHNEARHLADLKSGKQATASTEKPSVEEAEVEQIPGSEKTKCNCGSTAEKCPCPPGKCGCANCAKSESATASAST